MVRRRTTCHTPAEAKAHKNVHIITANATLQMVIYVSCMRLHEARALQDKVSTHRQVTVDIYDKYGIGSGGSGAAAGILHPFTPKGAVAWMGIEAYAATCNLVSIAAAAAAAAAAARQYGAGAAAQLAHEPLRSSQVLDAGCESSAGQIVRRTGILRLGAHAQQSWELVTNLQAAQAAHGQLCGGVPVTAAEARALHPGLSEQSLAAARQWRAPKLKERKSIKVLRRQGA